MVQSILQMAKWSRRKFLLVVYVHFPFVQHPRMLRVLLYLFVGTCDACHVTFAHYATHPAPLQIFAFNCYFGFGAVP